MDEFATLWTPDLAFPQPAQLRLPDQITHRMLHRGDERFQFLHESAIVRHGSRWFAAWNNSPAGESQAGTAVRWIAAADPLGPLSHPRAMAPPLDHPTTVWESVQLLSTDGELWALVGQVHSQPRQPAETGGSMVVFCFDAVADMWRERSRVEGFHPLNRPQRLPGGAWIVGGQYNLIEARVAISRDLLDWQVIEIPSRPDSAINFAETALIVGDRTVTAIVRSTGPVALTSTSDDGGASWRPLTASNLPMSSSKPAAGQLSTGQRFLAFNMRPDDSAKGNRDTLAIAVSAPGEPHFRKVVPIRHGQSPKARTAGFAKGPQWSYPSVEEAGGNVYISYSVTKEDCCLSVLPLAEFTV